MAFASALRQLYPSAVPVQSFASWTREVLAPFDFAPGTCLPLFGFCRDELVFAVERRLHDEWGPSFDLSSLAGMALIGRSAIEAAAQHAPDAAGRRRYVVVVLPHIGIDAGGSIGTVHREGLRTASVACGALAQVRAELLGGRTDAQLDPGDLELSMVRRALLHRIGQGAVPELVELTEMARQVGADEIRRLTADLVSDAGCDVAVISGTLIHGPDGDWVAPAQSWVNRGDGPAQPLPTPGG